MYFSIIMRGVIQMLLGAASLAAMLKYQATSDLSCLLASIAVLALGIGLQARLVDKLKTIVAMALINDLKNEKRAQKQ